MTDVLDPLAATQKITSSYRRYLLTTFGPRRDDLRKEFERALDESRRIARGPFLEASAPFEPGVSIDDLIAEGVLDAGFERLATPALPLDRVLHLHQEQAIRKAVAGRNLIVATGTGSGKTESFLVPIVDHLLREHRAGTLAQPGVRALLLYPMNALANDQVKRLRSLLANVPEITFGRYVGDTPTGRDEALDTFRTRFPGETPLPNEMLCRERMQAAPPHILLTNYAMLEYLLLRPRDSSFFDGPTGQHWRFVVLDEAHVYNGAQGTEIAMLLRRVRDRVVESERGRIQCFATSATLGHGERDHPALVDFAHALFDEEFVWQPGDGSDATSSQDIVTATRMNLASETVAGELDQGTYGELQKLFRSGASAPALYACINGQRGDVASPAEGVSAPAFLAALLRHDRRVVELQRRLEQGSVDLNEIAQVLFTGPDARSETVALVDLCVGARERPDDAPLIPARYHFFVRSMEGGFVCLHPDHRVGEPRLLLDRHEMCPSCAAHGLKARMFELGICRNCRAEYLVGDLDESEGHACLEPSKAFATERAYLLLGEGTSVDDEDEQVAFKDAVPKDDDKPADAPEVAWLCTGCGVVGESEAVNGCTCTTGPEPVETTIFRPQHRGEVLHRCASCATRSRGEVVSRFLTGSEAPVAVVATELYQQLPRSSDPDVADHVGRGRKLLAFSDSRRDAAFFAPYFERTYNRAVQRRLIAEAIDKLAPDGAPRFEDVALAVRKLAERDEVLDPDESSHTNLREVNTWLMHEVFGLDRRQSIEGTGIAEISIYVPRKARAPRTLTDLGFTDAEAFDLIQLLLESVRASGAVTVPDGVDVRDEAFAPRNLEITMRSRGSSYGILSWLPTRGDNRRLEMVMKIFAKRGVDADPREILDEVWEGLTRVDSDWKGTLVATPAPKGKDGIVHRLNSERVEFLPAGDDHRPGRCGTCHRVWWRSISGVCPTWRCEGTVETVDESAGSVRDHYAALYRELAPIAARVEEHTANFKADRAAAIQQDFLTGRVNVLSCSTTFELGVDVGEVQAVLLRNVPPTPANYVQRAGRAGRRTDSAALVVTFAQRRSHDRFHYEHPERLVDGVVDPPSIDVTNVNIGRRHAHSVAFAAFERASVDSGGVEHRDVSDFFEPASSDPGSLSGRDAFERWLRDEPEDLKRMLQRTLPAEVAAGIGVDDWSWVDALTTPDEDEPMFGWLQRATEEVLDELRQIDNAMDVEARAAADDPEKAERHHRRAAGFARTRRTLVQRHLFGHLASCNVLPKYGFPVDVVNLNVFGSGDADAGNLDLSRDLAIAISDYAPGSATVAAKKLWDSVGVRLLPSRKWPTYRWGVCHECGAFRQQLDTDVPLPPCPVCGESKLSPGRSGSYILPVFGFVGELSKDKVGTTLPPRLSATDRYFGSYDDAAQLERVAELSHVVPVATRVTKQGHINIINRGGGGRGFRVCHACGYAEPAPKPGASSKEKKPKGHKRPGGTGSLCSGSFNHHQLGHRLLTDVTQIAIATPMDENTARSVLYAVLEGVDALGIARDDVDGTLHTVGVGQPPQLIIHDVVPGGAGHVRRVAENLPVVFRSALNRVRGCSCGEETSCYGCLRNYRNQLFHEQLSRGAAAEVLARVLGVDTGRPVPETADEPVGDPLGPTGPVRRLVDTAIARGFADFVVGGEVGPDNWPVDVVWPDARVVVDDFEVADRDAWFEANGWTRLTSSVDADVLVETLRR